MKVFEDHLQNMLEMIQGNPAIGAGVLVAVGALFYFRPKDMLKLVAFCLFMVAVFYIMTLLLTATDSGVKHKDGMIYKSRDVAGE